MTLSGSRHGWLPTPMDGGGGDWEEFRVSGGPGFATGTPQTEKHASGSMIVAPADGNNVAISG